MIIYEGRLKEFHRQVFNGEIANLIEEYFRLHGINHNNPSEHRAFQSSLSRLSSVLAFSKVNEDLNVAIEYQIPLTSKRVDFIITGKDEEDHNNVVIIELKQWEKCDITDKNDLVLTYTGGGLREVPHPSYQAYSYAKTIENFNEDVNRLDYRFYPCAYLHNFDESFRDKIGNVKYKEALALAPIFLEKDAQKLSDFIKQYVSKSDDGLILYTIDHGKIKPSIALQDEITKMIRGNDSFSLIDEQKIAYENILSLVRNDIDTNKKHTIIVKGGPGTGKSVIAVKLLANLIGKGYSAMYTSKNSAPREVYAKELIANKFKGNYIKNLFSGSGKFVNSKLNELDVIVADEAHRLNDKSGLYKNLGENQIKEIIHASKISVFFIDEKQRVTSSDIGTIDEIKKRANLEGSQIHEGEELTLSSQFRCNGSDGYLAFLENLLGIRGTANYNLEELDYDFEVFDDPNILREKLREKNKINNKSRMVAGYCYEWSSKKDHTKFDIVLKNGFIAQWNFSQTSTWAIDENSFEQIGCIHTCQGLEFDYVGVIIGKDMIYRDGKVRTDYTKRAKSDMSLKGFKNKEHEKDCDEIIRNTYRTLMTRGQKGCYVYCEDEELTEYIKKRLKAIK